MKAARIAAHLILGPREEPFLPALLDSVSQTCAMLVVNDNAPEPSPHTGALRESAFGREGRAIVDRTPFTNFSTARNVCLDVHRRHDAGEWVAFVDADEVHGARFARIGRHLNDVPRHVDFVDGYTWHFFQSFDWYRSIERRMSFFRFSPNVRWEGAVHERLHGLSGRRLALPYLYAHYGWVLPIARQAAKEELYAALGAPGKLLFQEELADPRIERSFRREWRTLLRFSANHPSAARAIVSRLRAELQAQFAAVDQLVAQHQSRRQRACNALMKLNYEQRWRARALDPEARRVFGKVP